MEQVDTESLSRESSGAFVFQSRPNCSQTRAQERLAFRGLMALCLGTAIGFAGMGYWLVLPFEGLVIGLLIWARVVQHGHESDYESLTIECDVVILEWRMGNQRGHRQMNRQWVRVACDCTVPGRDCRLCVSSHGRETEVGHYLSDEARLQLAATLRRKLQA